MPQTKKKTTKTKAKKTAKKPVKKVAKKAKSAPNAKKASTGGKKAKIDLDYFREKFEEMRANLIKTLQRKREEAQPDQEVGDEADVAVNSLARDLTFELTGNEQHLLEEVEAALRRIEQGTYGVCEGSGKPITIARLKALPYARYCMEYQNQFESV